MNWINKFWLKLLDILPIILGIIICIILVLIGVITVVALFRGLIWMIGGM